MPYHKLRTAWSVFWGAVALLLVAIWVRSYWRWDSVTLPLPCRAFGASFDSFDGRLRFLILDSEGSKWQPAMDSYDRSFAQETMESWITIGEQHGGILSLRYAYHLDFQVLESPRLLRIHCTHWLGALLCGCLSLAPWLSWRFSLHTLLVATTLAAVTLGLVVWASE